MDVTLIYCYQSISSRCWKRIITLKKSRFLVKEYIFRLRKYKSCVLRHKLKNLSVSRQTTWELSTVYNWIIVFPCYRRVYMYKRIIVAFISMVMSGEDKQGSKVLSVDWNSVSGCVGRVDQAPTKDRHQMIQGHKLGSFLNAPPVQILTAMEK